MPRVKKTKTKVKNKNKNKVVVRNVININSNNKRKGVTKPSFQQLSQQPRSTGSTVVSHFIQQPTSAYNPQVESGLVKSLEIARDLITKAQEREANLIREDQKRIREGTGRRLSFEVDSPSSRDEEKVEDSTRYAYNRDASASPIVEKGGGGIFSRFTPFRNSNMVASFGGSERGPSLDQILRGTRPTELGTPQGNALGLSPPRTALRGQQDDLEKQLEELTKDDLRALFKNVTKANAPPASKSRDIINKLLNEFREETGRMLVQSTAKKGGAKSSK